MRKLIIFFTVSIFSVEVNAQNQESTIKLVSPSVVFLNDTKIETISIGGKNFEVWLKNISNAQFIPKTSTRNGSSFLVYDSANISHFLVTADHVAKEMTLNSDIVINGPADRSIIFKLKELSLRKDSLIWTSSPAADVAVLLLDNNSEILNLTCPEIACQKTIQNGNKCEKKYKTKPQKQPAL